MGKHGPCYHCGVTSTPLWRNGPPEKPILCNACGSRWRTKGSLVNYTPLHSRAEPNECENYKIPRANIMVTKHKEPKVLKRKQNHVNKVFRKIAPSYNCGLLKTMETDTSNRSSSGSALSNVSESCVQYVSVDVNELTGPAHSAVWDQIVPSRKRTCVNRQNQSQVEKLTRDLYSILHKQQYSHFSGSSEEDLLFDSDRPMVSVEIGHGSVLIRHPSSIAQEEDSEASSISVENNAHLVHDSPPFPLHVNKVMIENNKKPFGLGIQQEQADNRDKDEHEKLLVLENQNSPLRHIDLKEIINYQVFASHVTNEEQQQLLKLLPEIDTTTLPLNLQNMFASSEFEEDLLSFQKLLMEGVFDFSFSGVKAEDCGKLKKLALSGSTKSTWVEHYSMLKDKEDISSKKGFISREGAKLLAYGSSTNVKRSRNGYFQFGSGTKTTVRNPNFNNFVEHSGSFMTPRSLFPLLDTFQYMDENSEQDLLLNVPTNSSFPEAELFYQTSPSSSSVYPRLNDPSKAF